MVATQLDPAALPVLRARLQRFRSKLPEIVEAMDRDIVRANRTLAEHHVELERRAQRLRREADDEEDDDFRGRAEQAAEEAEERLNRFKRQLQNLGDLVSKYRADARRARTHCEGPTLAACMRLDSLYALALAALAVVPESGGGASVTGAIGSTNPAEAASTEASGLPQSGSADDGAANLPILPEGFHWVPLDRTHPGLSDWPAPAEFSKGVSYQEVCEGTQRLHDEMLPLFRKNPAAGRAVFEEYDQKNGRSSTGLVNPKSLAHLYDQFFARGNLMYCWVRPEDGLYEFGNGRHRIRAAMDLGLRFVPAQIQKGTKA